MWRGGTCRGENNITIKNKLFSWDHGQRGVQGFVLFVKREPTDGLGTLPALSLQKAFIGSAAFHGQKQTAQSWAGYQQYGALPILPAVPSSSQSRGSWKEPGAENILKPVLHLHLTQWKNTSYIKSLPRQMLFSGWLQWHEVKADEDWSKQRAGDLDTG